jgi:hypothetical protein
MNSKEVTTENVLQVDAEALRREMFKLIEQHVDYLDFNRDKFMFLLGYYPSIYSYVSELFTFMINKVREAKVGRLGGDVVAARMDKRDVLDQVLKAVKFQYDSLSRKITIITAEEEHAL